MNLEKLMLRFPKLAKIASKTINTIRARYALIKYKGDKVKCPFCKKRLSTFVSTGVLERPFWKNSEGRNLLKKDYINVPNANCPVCGSSERHRLLYFFLIKKLNFLNKKGITLLDIAPDIFLQDALFKKIDIKYISIDLRKYRNPTYIMNIKDLRFPNDHFDMIICYHVLEYIDDDVKAMKELYRVLKPKGIGIIQVPIWAEKTIENKLINKKDYELYYGNKDHVRRYGLDYKNRLESVGFKVKFDKFSRSLPDSFIKKYGLFKTEDIYMVTK